MNVFKRYPHITNQELAVSKNINEEENKQEAIRKFNYRDVTNIVGLSNTLKAWFEGKEALTVKEAEMLVAAIKQSAKTVLDRLDTL